MTVAPPTDPTEIAKGGLGSGAFKSFDVDPNTPDRATLQLCGLTGWYRAIADAADRDWEDRRPEARIHVMYTTADSVGSFRQSPATALWSAVPERIHLAGN